MDWENPSEKGMDTHFSILAWRIPQTEEPGGLPIVHGVAKSQTLLSTDTHGVSKSDLTAVLIRRGNLDT